MNALQKIGVVAHIARWRLNWGPRDTGFRPPGLDNQAFVSARDACRTIPDGSTVISSGMAGNMRCSIFYWAVRELFLTEGRPRDLTWVAVGGLGGRGRLPGTLEEVGLEGLVTRVVAGHVETLKSIQRLAGLGRCELHTLPQGLMTFLLEAQAAGSDSIVSDTGVGTFVDPRCGTGSVVAGDPNRSLVSIEGERLRYRLPRIDTALFVATGADREGNVYMDDACMTTESFHSALAARANGGRVVASVAGIVEPAGRTPFLPAGMVDAIVVDPGSEQTGSIPQRRHWPMFTTRGRDDVHESVEKLKFANRVIGITPVRGPVEDAVARTAADLFTRVVPRGGRVNIGVGMPEEVCRLIYEGGLLPDVTFLIETGVLGGLPAPGVFFGAAIRPERIVSSTEMFHEYYRRLDATVLGLLQADGQGNVNVSRRGPGPSDYVGPGGLIDLTTAARTIIFVGSWMAHARFRLEAGRIVIERPGRPKFVERVDEVTFNGAEALKRGQSVWYVTTVGIFRLTRAGMELAAVMPGIDVGRQVVGGCPMRVVLPEMGRVPVIDRRLVTGRGFRLAWPGRPEVSAG